ncbi:Delta-aminolevulinic acid dehydratase [compost metagenome]
MQDVVPVSIPRFRPRRLRATEAMRRMVREHHVHASDLIWPLFAVPGTGIRHEVVSMPGVFQCSVDEVVKDAKRAHAAGLGGIILFGLPPEKDEIATGAYDPNGIVQEAVRAVKAAVPELMVITDVCLCEYTSHGHCGVIHGEELLNDPTLSLLAKTAVSHAEAGADMVAPSDMMDGRVGAMRDALDAAGFANVPIMAYSVKYASAYYGPFRDAADSTPQFGDRRSYQMDPANAREALKEAALDVAEGADIVMVKPALAYMDVILRVKQATDRPVACYNVSGEYAMVKAAARQGWIDERKVVMETMVGFKRAGADLILTYHAMDVAGWLAE